MNNIVNNFDRITKMAPKENELNNADQNNAAWFNEMNDDDNNMNASITVEYTDSMMMHRFMWLVTTATDGLVFFRALAFVGGLGMMITTMLVLILRFDVRKVLLGMFTIIFGFLICILEAPFFFTSTNSKSSQKLIGVRNVILEYAKFLRFLWGRGSFQLFAGSIQVTQVKNHMASGSGAFMCCVGILSILVGRSASRRVKELRKSLNDELLVKERFAQIDINDDGYITLSEFSSLVRCFGVALSTKESLAAFRSLDRDNNNLISENQFLDWWLSFNVNGIDDAVLNP